MQLICRGPAIWKTSMSPAGREKFSTICEKKSTALCWRNTGRRNTDMKRALRYILFYSALIGIWALLAKLRIWPPYVFPNPQGVAETLWAGFADNSFWIAIAVSMRRMLIGYGIS